MADEEQPRSSSMRPLWEMGLGSVLALLLTLVALNLVWISQNVAQVPLYISIIAACYGLYLIRHFYRIAYGFLEILVGMFVIFGTIGRAPGTSDVGLLIVQLAAGMYVIIRGFDNFAQSEPFAGGGRAFQALWEFIRRRRA